MRIGIVLPSVPGYSETFFKNKILGLQQHGIDVVLFVKNLKGHKSYLCPVKVHPNLSANPMLRFLQSMGWLIRCAVLAPQATRRLWGITKKEGYSPTARLRAIVIAARLLPEKLDWLHFGFATPAIEREFIGAAIQAKVAVSFRGFDINQTPLLENNPYRKFWSQIDKVHTISSYLLVCAQKMGLSTKVPAVKITPAIDTAAFLPGSTAPKPKSILLVSRLHWIKGIEYVLEAIAEVMATTPEVMVTIIGSGSDHERLQFAAYQLGIAHAVTFLGEKTKEDIIVAMQSHEVFVQYSLQEGFCNAALEAQACGMLCVVSDADGLVENVLHQETGWVVPKRQPKALAKQIQTVFELPEQSKNHIRVQARNRTVSEFSLAQQQQAFVDFYTT